jgi:hypothetical protein
MQVGVLIFVTIALVLSAQATKFSNASLKGSYSFLTNLWTANASTSQFAMVGVLTFDGAGNVTGSYTSLSLQVFQTGTLGGTYTVNSNGTGTITFTTGSTAQFAINLDSTAAGVAHGVQLLQTNDSNNEIVSGTAVLQSTTAETYSAASLKGTFAFQWNLWTADASEPQASLIEIGTFDGKGNCAGAGTMVVDGKTTTGTDTGTYTVNPDGSGSLSVSPNTQVAFVLNSVTAGKAKGVQFIQNLPKFGSGDYVITGAALSAQATKFSNASLKGSYSFLTNLWTANASTNQSAMVGVLTFDGAGNVTGSYTSLSLQVFQTGTLGGTYTVNSNGTGTIAFTSGSTAQFAITLNSTAAKVAHGVQLLRTNDSNNEIVSGTAVLQSTTAETYSVASLKGTLSDQWNLWTAELSEPQASLISVGTFDGKGNYTGSYTSVYDGKLGTKTQAGTYTVSPDGTGSLSLPGSQHAFALNTVAAGQAKGVQFITNIPGGSSGNYVISGTGLKQ